MSVQSASPTSLTPEKVGEVWGLRAKCAECQVGVILVSEEEPSEMAMTFARIGVVCDLCDSTREAAEDRRRLRDRLSQRVTHSGLPNDLHNLSWADMDRQGKRRPVIAAARAWAEGGGRMLLTGPIGTGKTRLAATAAWDVLQCGPVTWISVPLLFVHAFMPATSPERKRAVDVMGGKGALVLDDLGKEKPGDWARQILFGAIDSRIQSGAPILITSNFDPDGLADRLGEAVGDRLGAFHQYELGGSSKRTPPERDLEPNGSAT